MKILAIDAHLTFAYHPFIQMMRRSTKLGLSDASEEVLIRQVPKETPSAISLPQRRRLIRRYHILIDKSLKGKLSSKQTVELRQIEQTLQSLEDAETSKIMRAHEERHSMMMQKLSALTAELRKIAVGSQPRSQASHSKAR